MLTKLWLQLATSIFKLSVTKLFFMFENGGQNTLIFSTKSQTYKQTLLHRTFTNDIKFRLETAVFSIQESMSLQAKSQEAKSQETILKISLKVNSISRDFESKLKPSPQCGVTLQKISKEV